MKVDGGSNIYRQIGGQPGSGQICSRLWSAVPCGTRFSYSSFPALPCRAFTYRRYAAGDAPSRRKLFGTTWYETALTKLSRGEELQSARKSL